MAKSKHNKKADAFNKKYKVGSKISYKDSSDREVTGILIHPAVAQETQASIYLKDAKGKVSLDKVTSKF